MFSTILLHRKKIGARHMWMNVFTHFILCPAAKRDNFWGGFRGPGIFPENPARLLYGSKFPGARAI